MRTEEIPAAQDEVLAVASKKVGAPTVPARGEATVIVGEAQAVKPRPRKSMAEAHLTTRRKYHIRPLNSFLLRNGKQP